MQGDFTRWTFRAEHDYRSVLLQQGRLLVDDGWNEQAEITAYHDEVRTLDVVGRSGGPAPQPGGGPGGFAVVDPDGNSPVGVTWPDLLITPGRYYVDGILCRAQPRDDPAAPDWPLVEQPHLREGLPEPPATDEEESLYALYLDVWEHHVTADEEPSLLEPALGGPDTTTRKQTVWQVRWARLDDENYQTCSDLHSANWLARTPRRMSAGLRPPAPDADPCRVTTSGGYQRLENQLYRVQVHDPGTGSTPPTFLWSRENGSVVAGLLDIRTTTVPGMDAVLVLDRQGRDDELSFRQGDLVEVTSTDVQLRGTPGHLGRAGAPDQLDLPVEWLDTPPASLAGLGLAPVVRRWEGGPTSADAAPTDLESGIFVRFPSGGAASTGDYWQIPARTVRLADGLTALSGTIDWPQNPGGAGLALPPAGPEHHVTPLAILLRHADQWTFQSDCRLLFPQLTGLVTLDLVGGDGQEELPGDPLPQPVRVVVRNGGRPVEGAMVRFVTEGGSIGLGVPPPGPASLVAFPTGREGVVAVHWRLDPAGPTTQTVAAQRLDDHGNPIDVQVIVTGRLSVASQVAWRPACEGLAEANTVQAALDHLATTPDLRLLGGDGQHVTRNGSVVPQAIRVVLDSPCGPVADAQVVAVTAGQVGLVAQVKTGESTPDELPWSNGGFEAGALTDADGVAAFWWQPDFGDGTSAVLNVFAPDADEGAAPVSVSAQLLSPAGRTGGLHVTALHFNNGEQTPFLNDVVYTPEDLASGITVRLDGAVIEEAVIGKPVARAVLSLPWLPGSDGDIWSGPPLGDHNVELAATLGADSAADSAVITWEPADETQGWLTGHLRDVFDQGRRQESIIGRFIIDGWGIVSQDIPRQHLNGHARAEFVNGRTLLRLPTDDEVTGGQFVQWFSLGPDRTPDIRVLVPEVVGRMSTTAERLISGRGLRANVVTEADTGVRGGLVARTEPEAGEEVDMGSEVLVVVSAGIG